MQIKPQPAPVILSLESVNTMSLITHHTKERPSTGPPMLRSSEVVLELLRGHDDGVGQLLELGVSNLLPH
jgi:hypothetical protein